MVTLVPRVLRDHRVRLDLLVLEELKGLKDNQETGDRMVSLVHKDNQGHRVLQELRVIQEPRVRRDQ